MDEWANGRMDDGCYRNSLRCKRGNSMVQVPGSTPSTRARPSVSSVPFTGSWPGGVTMNGSFGTGRFFLSTSATPIHDFFDGSTTSTDFVTGLSVDAGVPGGGGAFAG